MKWLTNIFNTPRQKEPVAPRIFLTNTLSGTKELFISQKPGVATMYSCGPTVYGPAHLGNMRSFVFSDTLARTLAHAQYRVRRVINITDFGHLVSDGDDGEDKMTKGLRRDGLPVTLENMRTMAEKYTAIFMDDISELQIATDDILFPRASDYIAEQIALIKTLEQKGYAYHTSGGVYFDIKHFANYGQLGGIDVSAQRKSARIEQSEKRHEADFVLWKSDPALGWQSPWGLGFPGWHIECSAMSRSLLGQEIDIHTGGEDHIAVHHNNEIAQSEAASGRTFVHYWLHNAFLTMNGEKASKSLGNVVYLADLSKKGYHPLALRYFFLQAQYRSPLSFSWEALTASANALTRLWKIAREVATESKQRVAHSAVRDQFLAVIRDDLATPQALSILWDTMKSDEFTPEEKWGLLEDAENHLGLLLTNPPSTEVLQTEIPQEIQTLLAEREKARSTKDFKEADRLREQIENSGYRVDDGPQGAVLTRGTF